MLKKPIRLFMLMAAMISSLQMTSVAMAQASSQVSDRHLTQDIQLYKNMLGESFKADAPQRMAVVKNIEAAIRDMSPEQQLVLLNDLIQTMDDYEQVGRALDGLFHAAVVMGLSITLAAMSRKAATTSSKIIGASMGTFAVVYYTWVQHPELVELQKIARELRLALLSLRVELSQRVALDELQ